MVMIHTVDDTCTVQPPSSSSSQTVKTTLPKVWEVMIPLRSTPSWLLLHGVPLTAAVWAPLVQRLSSAVTADILAPTLVAAQNSPDVQSDLALRLINDLRQNPGPLHIVGYSFGGQVALEFALGAPELSSSLTLLCTRDTPFPPFTELSTAVRARPVDIEESLKRWFGPAELSDNGPAVRYARQSSDRSPTIAAPTLVVAAENDGVSTVEAMSVMASRIPGAQMRVLPGAGHMSPFADPAALAQLLLDSADRATKRR